VIAAVFTLPSSLVPLAVVFTLLGIASLVLTYFKVKEFEKAKVDAYQKLTEAEDKGLKEVMEVSPSVKLTTGIYGDSALVGEQANTSVHVDSFLYAPKPFSNTRKKTENKEVKQDGGHAEESSQDSNGHNDAATFL